MFKRNRLCMRALVVAAISCLVPFLQNFWTYTYSPGLEYDFITILYSISSLRESFAPDEMWEVRKTEVFDHIKASQPERAGHWWRSWRTTLKVLSYLYPAIPAPRSNFGVIATFALSAWRVLVCSVFRIWWRQVSNTLKEPVQIHYNQ